MLAPVIVRIPRRAHRRIPAGLLPAGPKRASIGMVHALPGLSDP
ncbi:MAG: hypothetical protein RIR65_9, partial [Planctomycetota bacterium]